MSRPIVWTIAGSDSGGGAGIQADLHTFQDLGTFGCTVITAITAQNSVSVDLVEGVSPKMLSAQLNILFSDLPPQAIKLGVLFREALMKKVAEFLPQYLGWVVCDPVIVSANGDALLLPEAKQCLIDTIFPEVSLITPNLAEAEVLLGRPLKTLEAVEKGAKELSQWGPKNVLIKSAPNSGHWAQDYWTDGQEGWWLTGPRWPGATGHGSGCSLSAAITACLALGHSLLNSLVIAKSYVSQGVRLTEHYGKGVGPVAHEGWPKEGADFPYLSRTSCWPEYEFPTCGHQPLGIYPIVPHAEWLERLLPVGVTTIQLRNKELTGKALRNEIQKAVKIAQQYGARLFINDYWELAIEAGAYGTHLGQRDLDKADLKAIQEAGLRLGISTHSEAEVARAHALKPSYLAFGPLYETYSKEMEHDPQGLGLMSEWIKRLPNYPWVGIGGIDLSRMADVVRTGVSGVAMISSIVKAENPEQMTKALLQAFNRARLK